MAVHARAPFPDQPGAVNPGENRFSSMARQPGHREAQSHCPEFELPARRGALLSVSIALWRLHQLNDNFVVVADVAGLVGHFERHR